MKKETDKRYRERVYRLVRSIPRGHVMTYGQIAEILGEGYTPRTVGFVMHGSDDRTPWHRVINAQGRISLPEDSTSYQEQKRRLAMEGIQFNNNKINLRIYGYNH